VPQPAGSRRRQIGVEDQARRRLHRRLMPLCRQLARRLGRAPVLPDDSAVQGLARRRVPDHRSLALVGDADGGETADAARLAHHLATGLQRRAPDLGRVMLDPARLRKMLRQLDLADGDRMKGPLGRDFKRDRPCRGRALVDGEDHICLHDVSYAEPAPRRKREAMHTPSFEGVVDAARQIAPAAVRTSLIEHPALNEAVGGRVLMKAETLQVAGAFKFRGAYNRISRLTDEEKTRGVVAYSSGNHAQGVAAAARAVGAPALIVMPSDSP